MEKFLAVGFQAVGKAAMSWSRAEHRWETPGKEQKNPWGIRTAFKVTFCPR